MTPASSTLLLLAVFPVFAQGLNMNNLDPNTQRTYQEYLRNLRSTLLEHSRNDECHCLGNPRGREFKKLAESNCASALFIFNGLRNENRVVCANARNSGCRKCGTITRRCAFHCDPTQLEIDIAHRQGNHPPKKVCKHLHSLLGPAFGA